MAHEEPQQSFAPRSTGAYAMRGESGETVFCAQFPALPRPTGSVVPNAIPERKLMSESPSADQGAVMSGW